ncbi:MAG: hypothetical protein ACFBWO_01100 [Paracoccaceae bacterium]
MMMLTETCRAVAAHPAPWALIAALVLAAVYGVIHLRYCPFVRGTARVSRTEALARLASPWIAGPAYALIMIGGIALMLAGLVLIANAAEPVAAFLTLARGIAVVQGAPVWLRLREAYDRVIAAEAEGAEAVAFARSRLVNLHLAGIATVLAIAGMLALALTVF